jgi:hypothetical protein
MGAMTKNKSNTNKPSTFTFGWCGGWPNEVDHESCPKSYVTATESANHKQGIRLLVVAIAIKSLW